MQSINLNLVPGSFQQVFNCSQGDIGRQLTAKLFDGSTAYEIPAGSTVKIKATKPSGFGFDESATFSGSTVTITTAETMTNEWGRFPAELVITKDGNVIGTANFLFNIEKNPHPDSTVDGDAEEVIPELTLLVERVEAAASSVLDMEVVATTLPAGSQASYSYDEDLNKATFGIPQGEAGAGAAGVVASAYSSSKTYKVGDYVIHNSNLYRCITAITTAEAFTAAHWTQIVLADDVSDLKSDLENTDKYTKGLSNKLDETSKKYDLWGLRGLLNGKFMKSVLPSYPHLSGLPTQIYTDGYKYIHNIDLTKQKNISANTVRVSTQAELESALSNATSGDTIILDDGVYTPITIDKSINLIGDGDVIFSSYDPIAFTQSATPGVYSKASSGLTFDNTYAVYQVIDEKNKIIVPLAKRTTVTDLINTVGSYFITVGNLYVHLYTSDVPTNKNVIISKKNTSQIIGFDTSGANITAYLKNISVIGGNTELSFSDSADYNSQKLIAVDCKFMGAISSNAITLLGVDGYFQRCECALAFYDGFNYHKNTVTNTLSNGLEVDCVSHDNGATDTSATPSDNGSTIHDGGKIVRIGGAYYNNNGGNIADINSGTESYNYGCLAFDSIAPHDNANKTSADFWVSGSAVMRLFGCRGLGDTEFNLVSRDSATMYATKCEYTTYDGTIN